MGSGQIAAQPGPGGKQASGNCDVAHGLREQRMGLAAIRRPHLLISHGLGHDVLLLRG
jgi:hypothetical protein